MKLPDRLRRPLALLIAGFVAASLVPSPALADPPAHAPAHGWRKKHDPYYIGYQGSRWPRDYGVIVGRCDYSAVGAVLGGAVGAAIGSQMGKGDGRAVAIVVGTVLGAVLGAQLARELTDADRACIGHSLELAPPGRRVAWRNPETGIDYGVIPEAGFRSGDRDCRKFTTEAYYEGRRTVSRGVACRDDEGRWRID